MNRVYLHYALETVHYRSIVTLIDISGSRPTFSDSGADGRDRPVFNGLPFLGNPIQPTVNQGSESNPIFVSS